MPDTSVSPANAIAWAGARGERLAPFVPSPQAMVDRMLTIARAGPGDMVYDLGSGDGQIVLAAAQQFGARGTGIEIDDDLVRLSSARIAGRGLGSRARIIHGDFLDADLRPATIVTLYQLPAVNELLRPMLEAQLRPGARVVSLDFPVPGWNPDRVETATLEDGSQHAIYLYPIVRTREVAVALQGTLDTFALPDVLRLLASTKKTGRLLVTGSRGSGSVWVDDGSVVGTEATGTMVEAGQVETLFELLRYPAFSVPTKDATNAVAGKL